MLNSIVVALLNAASNSLAFLLDTAGGVAAGLRFKVLALIVGVAAIVASFQAAAGPALQIWSTSPPWANIYGNTVGSSASAVCGLNLPFTWHYSDGTTSTTESLGAGDSIPQSWGPELIEERWCIERSTYCEPNKPCRVTTDNHAFPAYDMWVCPFGSNYETTTPARGCNTVCPPGTRYEPVTQSCLPYTVNPRTGKPPAQCTDSGNPIYPLTGTKREQVDLGIRIGDLPLVLTYDTSGFPGGTGHPLADTAQKYVLGSLWSSNLHRSVYLQGSLGVQVSRGDGHISTFVADGSGNYTPDPDVNDQLFKVASGWRYVDVNSRSEELYDSAGNLTAIQWAGGAQIVVSYSDTNTSTTIAPAPGYLISVRDQSGRSVSFQYTLVDYKNLATGGRIAKIIDPALNTINISYGQYSNLSTIGWQDGAVRTFIYNDLSPTQYWALTGIVDEKNVRYATFGYNSSGAVVSTEHAGGVNRYSTSYPDYSPSVTSVQTYNSASNTISITQDWAPPSANGTPVTDPAGTSNSLYSSLILGKPYITARTQPAGSGCSASTQYLEFDEHGNPFKRDEFNGARICYKYDLVRNLETTRAEGWPRTEPCDIRQMPAGARKINTVWHPDWRLQTKVAEPKKLTTYVFNGQPDPFNGSAIASCAPASAQLPDGKPIAVLCKQVEQATTDADGNYGFAATLDATIPLRGQSFTYNQFGQLLTKTDPRNNVTSLAYYPDSTADHTVGDLQTVTDAAGHITRHTKYNPHGQPLEVIDANGLVTTYSYDARLRSTSVNVGGRLTTYEYDLVGQLKKVTLPDTVVLQYSYDDAHRLTGITDGAGNTVTYTLDGMGNRTGETYKDASNALARNITRVYDALNRLQSVTGAPQ